MLPDTRTRFELMVDRAEILRELSYIKFLQSNNLSFSLKWHQEGGLSKEGQHPDAEALLAVATILRFFTQPRDNIALILDTKASKKGTMDEVLDDPAVSQEWKNHYRFVVGELRKKLAGPAIPVLQLKINEQTLTAWDVFETIFYGDIVHANSNKRPNNVIWKSFGDPVYSMLRFAVHNTVADILQTADYVARLCRDELAGKPIPAFVAPAAPTIDETGALPLATDSEPMQVKTPTVMDLLDQTTWMPIPEALTNSNILGWSCTIIVFDHQKQADTKGIIVILLDTRGVTKPADMEGKPLNIETYAWTELPPETDPKALALEALSQKAREIVMKFAPGAAEQKFNYHILPPEQLTEFINLAVQAYQSVMGESHVVEAPLSLQPERIRTARK